MLPQAFLRPAVLECRNKFRCVVPRLVDPEIIYGERDHHLSQTRGVVVVGMGANDMPDPLRITVVRPNVLYEGLSSLQIAAVDDDDIRNLWRSNAHGNGIAATGSLSNREDINLEALVHE